MRKLLSTLWAVLFLELLLFLAFLNSHLPERFPIHFDFQGNANGWGNRPSFLTQFAGISVMVNGLFLVLGSLVSRLPPSLINWPNKAYWFANAERRAIVYDRIRAISALSGIFVDVTLLFCLFVIYQESGRSVPVHVSVRGGMFALLGLGALLVPCSFWLTRIPRR